VDAVNREFRVEFELSLYEHYCCIKEEIGSVGANFTHEDYKFSCVSKLGNLAHVSHVFAKLFHEEDEFKSTNK
jgi:hypothetical protein